MQPAVTLNDVGLRYRKRKSFFRHEYYQALHSVTFDVYQGETVGVIGRNGSGKSTLLRLMAGIFMPDEGLIEKNGLSTSLLSLNIGLDTELSGRDNIVISAMLMGASKQQAISNIDWIIEFSGLADFVDEPVKTYSAGMKMRLGFSVAICHRPDILLIDEGLGVGDIDFKKKAETAITDRIRSEQTVVLASHSTSQILDLCNRVVWLERGTVKMQGEPKKVVKAYQQYVGSPVVRSIAGLRA